MAALGEPYKNAKGMRNIDINRVGTNEQFVLQLGPGMIPNKWGVKYSEEYGTTKLSMQLDDPRDHAALLRFNKWMREEAVKKQVFQGLRKKDITMEDMLDPDTLEIYPLYDEPVLDEETKEVKYQGKMRFKVTFNDKGEIICKVTDQNGKGVIDAFEMNGFRFKKALFAMPTLWFRGNNTMGVSKYINTIQLGEKTEDENAFLPDSDDEAEMPTAVAAAEAAPSSTEVKQPAVKKHKSK